MIDALRRSIRHLQDHPRLGTELDKPSGLRQWVAGGYIVRYLPDEDIVHVLRIWHGKEQRPDA